MKKSIFYLFAVVCAMCLFTACSDDDDDDNKSVTVNSVVGTYKGTLKVLQESIPNTSISLTKVSDSKINIELKNVTFMSIPVGDIKVECDVWSSENGLEITGSGNVTIAILGITVPVSVEGVVNNTTLDIDIDISEIPALGSIKAEFTGKK